MHTLKSFCRFCHAVCGIEVDVEANRVVNVRGDKDHPVSQGYLCVKGRALVEQHDHPDRLRSACTRMADGSWRDISSRQGMDEVAQRIEALIARDGPQAIAVYSGTHGLFSSAKPLIIAWINGIGSHWYFTPNTIDQPSQQTAAARHGGWNAGVQRFSSWRMAAGSTSSAGRPRTSTWTSPTPAHALPWTRCAPTRAGASSNRPSRCGCSRRARSGRRPA